MKGEVLKYSRSLSAVQKEAPTQSASLNHQLLVRGGFMRQEAAGIYSLLPNGKRVEQNIEKHLRQAMRGLGAEEISLPVLQPKEYFDITGRWETIDVLFKVKGSQGNEYGLAATAEEVVVPVVKDKVRSFRDLPLAVYQIGEKFRDEKRPKSGIIRGREFTMKDMYSFHATREDFVMFYEKAKATYLNFFQKMGLDVKVTEASGGDFTVLPTHEFQVISEAGEDTIINCNQCTFAQNTEVSKLEAGHVCPGCGQGELSVNRSVEVGHIFDLGSKYTEAFDFTYADSDGSHKPILMGCYGIGTSRLIGTIVEAHHDDKGILWPEAVSPFNYHLTALGLDQPAVEEQAQMILGLLEAMGATVLFDDRLNVSAGVKFATADLVGIPERILISPKTASNNLIEIKKRGTQEGKMVDLDQLGRIIEARNGD